MIEVKEYVMHYRDSELMDEEFLDWLELNENCADCGSPHLINETLTKIICSNRLCNGMLLKRIEAFILDLDFKNIGPAKILTILEKFPEIKGPLDLLWYEPSDGPLGNKIDMVLSIDFYRVLQEFVKRPLGEVIKFANLPGIRDGAYKLFDGYSKIEVFYEDLEREKLKLIRRKLDLSAESAIKAVSLYETLMSAKSELFRIAPKLDCIDKSNGNVLEICITGDLIGRTKKKFKQEVTQYASALNLNLTFKDSMSNTIDYLIVDDATSNSTKLRYAQKNGIKMLSSMDFYSEIESLYARV